MSAPYSRLEVPLSEYSIVCRGCLANSGEMKNMYEWGLSEDFYKFADIQMQSTETISQLLCSACEQNLNMCRQFREQCQTSDVLLQKMSMKTSLNMKKESLKNTITSILHDQKLIIMIDAPNTEEKVYLPCPFHCTDRFIKKKDLYSHLNRTHNVIKSFEIELQYYCSVESCSYHVSSDKNKWFSERKFLNQHFNKTHRDRIYECDSCKLNFPLMTDLNRHKKDCSTTYICEICNITYKKNENLLVHLMRRHPDLHVKYKQLRKAEKRKLNPIADVKKQKIDNYNEDSEFTNPKISLATQITADNKTEELMPWQSKDFETRTDEISTQTVFEDLLSLKSQNSEDEILFSETVSLSDIQTQTFPMEFGMSRSHKETQYIASQTQSPDLSMKETQTCFCHRDSPKHNFRLFDSLSSSPASINLTSTETQTADARFLVKSDVMLSFNSTETQTCFDDSSNDSM